MESKSAEHRRLLSNHAIGSLRSRLKNIGTSNSRSKAQRRDASVIRTPEDLRARECSIAALTNKLAGLLLAEAMQASIENPENRSKARSLTEGAGRTIKDQGRRDVTLRTTCGQVEIRLTSAATVTATRRAKGCIRCWCSGVYMTAARRELFRRFSKLVAILGSLEEVERVLFDRGQPLDIKTIQALAYGFAMRTCAAQRVGSLNWGETVAGRRVVLSTDGGRIRIRTNKRGPKTAGAQPLSVSRRSKSVDQGKPRSETSEVSQCQLLRCNQLTRRREV